MTFRVESQLLGKIMKQLIMLTCFPNDLFFEFIFLMESYFLQYKLLIEMNLLHFFLL